MRHVDHFDWRREDWGYAAATTAAAFLVAYLVAGNFGLVRSPFVADELDGPSASVPALAVSRSSRNPSSAPASPGPAPATATPLAPATDLSPPSTQIDSAGGTVLSVTESSKVTGVASDTRSGVDRVMVAFASGPAEPRVVPATVTCTDSSRTNCTWTVEVPDLAGDYTVTPQVTDRAGNVAFGMPVDMTVVNLGGLVEDLLGRSGLLNAVLKGLLG